MIRTAREKAEKQRYLQVSANAAGTDATVATESPAYLEMEALRHLPRALMAGTDEPGGMISDENRTKYLPQLEGEHENVYEFRYKHLTAQRPFFEEAVSGIVTAILSAPIQLDDDVPEVIRGQRDGEGNQVGKGIWDDLDRSGQSGDTFFSGVGENSSSEGLSLILVDHTSTGMYESKGEEQRAGSRAYCAHIKAKDAIELTAEIDGARVVLGRAKIRINQTEPKEGGWGWQTKKLIRVFLRGNPAAEDVSRYASFQDWEQQENTGVWSRAEGAGFIEPPSGLSEEGRRLFTEIPIVPMYSGFVRPYYTKPPLGAVAQLCRLHLLKSSDRANIEHYANVPRPLITGMTREQFDNAQGGAAKVGADRHLFVVGDGASAGYLEHSGAAIGALRQSIEDLEKDIREAIHEATLQRASGAELATVRFFNENKRLTRLAVKAMWWREAIERTLQWLAAFEGYDDPGTFTMPKLDLQSLLNTGEQADFLVKTLAVGGISKEGFLEAAVELGRLPDVIDPANEIKRLEGESNNIVEGMGM
jgi:hypothetical protein